MDKVLTIISMILALLPTLVIMCIILGNARKNTNQYRKIITVFMISIATCIPAAILEMIGQNIETVVFVVYGVNVNEMSKNTQIIYMFIQYMFIVGTVEELCKYLTFKLVIFNDRYFDNTYDGLIYGAASALGFATFENILYIFGSQEVPIITALLRAALSIPLHAVTGMIMGHYFGVSKYRKYNNINATSSPEIRALIASMIIHGLYDFVVTIPMYNPDNSYVGWVIFIVMVLMTIAIYITMAYFVKKGRKNSLQIYNGYYYERLNGAYQDRIGVTTYKLKKIRAQFDTPYYISGSNESVSHQYTAYHPTNMASPNNPVYNELIDDSKPINMLNEIGDKYYQRLNKVFGNTNINKENQTDTEDLNNSNKETETIQSYSILNTNNLFTSSHTKVCSMCGKTFENDCNFCSFCGNKLD